jgi:hypothetical protein
MVMSDTDQKREDEVLRRMLATKPTPHKPARKAEHRKLDKPINESDF